jgi:NAD(P)-dependent dehydrogenase (short-subunit alcohol dehydrogenase family)
MDVTNEEQVEAGIAAAADKLGGIDVLVSNAGIQIVAPDRGPSISPTGRRCWRSTSTAPS